MLLFIKKKGVLTVYQSPTIPFFQRATITGLRAIIMGFYTVCEICPRDELSRRYTIRLVVDQLRIEERKTPLEYSSFKIETCNGDSSKRSVAELTRAPLQSRDFK